MKYRVWAIFHHIAPVWFAVSGLFPDQATAEQWAEHLNTDYRIEPEDDDE